jgi:hypothetical protein
MPVNPIFPRILEFFGSIIPMKLHPLFCLLVGIGLAASGCGKKAPTQVEVAVDPAAVSQAFSNAPPEVQQQVGQAVDSIQGGDSVAGFEQLMRLQNRPGLTPDQQRETGKAVTASLQKMQKAAGNGDQKAQQALDRYRASR